MRRDHGQRRAPDAAGGGRGTGVHADLSGYAGIWRRLAAALIDVILVVSVADIFFRILNGIGEPLADAAGDTWWRLVLILVGIVVLTPVTLGIYAYFPVMESSSYQATVGKIALRIRVTDGHGNRISFGRAFGRNAAKILSVLTVLIGFVMAAFTARKQALHDMIADTLVVKRGEQPARPKRPSRVSEGLGPAQ